MVEIDGRDRIPKRWSAPRSEARALPLALPFVDRCKGTDRKKVRREKIRKGESQNREDQRGESQREGACERKGRKVAKHCVFPMLCSSRRSGSRFAKAAGAEPTGQIRDEKLHASVARTTF